MFPFGNQALFYYPIMYPQAAQQLPLPFNINSHPNSLEYPLSGNTVDLIPSQTEVQALRRESEVI